MVTGRCLLFNSQGLQTIKKAEEAGYLPSHPSAFFGTAATCLRASLAVVNVVPVTFLSTSVTNVSAQVAKLLCKLAVH